MSLYLNKNQINKNNMKTLLTIVGVIMLVMAGAIGYLLPKQAETKLGSVAQSNEYHYTTTKAGGSSAVIKTEAGVLGSVIITGTGGAISVYDATTTNVNLRALATSSLPMLANLPASTAVGTYTFDTFSTNGLVLAIEGTAGTSTLTWR